MATLATYFRRSEALVPAEPATRKECDPYRLRALPNEDVFFFCKRIDNSRLVREADPRARGACWSAIGTACAVMALLTAVLAPNVANTMAGYHLQSLKKEEARMVEERRVMQLEEAKLRSLTRLDTLAREQNLVTPSSSQVVHLENSADSSLASLKK